MKYCPIKKEASSPETLAQEYRSGSKAGTVRLSETHFFFRKMRTVYYISYEEIQRCFRRVVAIPMKVCCGGGELQLEHLVICDGEKELAVVQLPERRTAQWLFEEMKRRAPHAAFTAGPFAAAAQEEKANG